jgi:hypothetical protein
MGLFNTVKTPDNTYHAVSLPYGYCETASATAAKVVTIPNVTELTEGLAILVRFKYANSASSPTLNVNGLGAKSIYRYGTTKANDGATTTGWAAGAVQLFVYNGTGWVRDYWSNTTYSNVALGQGYATCTTDPTTVAKTATLSNYALTTGGIVAVQFVHGNSVSSPTLNINNKGAKPIYFRGSELTRSHTINSGDICTFMYTGSKYELLSNTRWDIEINDLENAVASKTSVKIVTWEADD